MHPDDLKNPDYRKGRYRPHQTRTRKPVHRPPLTQDARRAEFAAQTARMEFGRFYWNGELARRLQQEMKETRRTMREAKEARRRRLNGAHT